MNPAKNSIFVEQFWDKYALPMLMEYIKIPNKSPYFDAEWEKNGYLDEAANLLYHWCKVHCTSDMKVTLLREPQRTPLIYLEIPGHSEQTILLYGHMDKQPEMTGWEDGLNPWQPIIKGERLYGRGSADDGYAVFAALTAILSLHQQKIPHARCIILIEASEESGSIDLPFYMKQLKDIIGEPQFIIGLDSGCGNYDQLWITSSLRGVISGNLKIEVLKEGIHSGNGSGVVPSCFLILRQLLDRIEEVSTGKILLESMYVDIPKERIEQAHHAAETLSQQFFADYPFMDQVSLPELPIAEYLLRKTWKPALSIIGSEGLPILQDAGNVTLPYLTIKWSMRLPPTCKPQRAIESLQKAWLTNPPFHAKVSLSLLDDKAGWHAPPEQPWLKNGLNEVSNLYFGKPSIYLGEGGSIPFIGMLGEKFPHSEFLITGVLGPKSNAHGPNEFLHLPTVKKLTACIAHIIAKHSDQAK